MISNRVIRSEAIRKAKMATPITTMMVVRWFGWNRLRG
jgi:hypothetical protein